MAINGKKILWFALCLLTVLHMIAPLPACAQPQENKVVRVGWHEAPYFITDKYRRRSGYSYEYQCKVAAFTGWHYEYVTGTWSQLLQKLKDGEIDLMSNISFMEERANDMMFASLPMGTEAYYIFVTPNNKEITLENYKSLNGKRIGVTKNSFQKELLRKWMQLHNVKAELIELTSSDEDSLLMLGNQLDAFVTMDFYGDPRKAVPIGKIGSSDFFFAVNKDRPDLLAELDKAMNRIQDENMYFNQQLHEKYLKSATTDKYLSVKEREWLSEHGPVRVGYQDNYLAFCAKDEATGELTGALKDYLELASTSLENAHIHFEARAYPTAAAAMEAMKKGEIDCVFPANLTDFDSETMGVVMSSPLMRSEMDAVVRASEKKEFLRKKQVIVAVNKGNTNYDMFLADHYPTWDRAYFADTPAGLEAVAKGKADCVIISNYRYNNISKQCEKLRLSTVYTGVDMDYCFAMRKGDTVLYSILSRVIDSIPDAIVHKSLTYYSTEDVKTSFTDLIKDNLFVVLTVIASVLVVILALLLRNIRAEKKILEEQHLVNDLNKRVFVDALTSVRNRGAFSNYIATLQERLDKKEPLAFAISVFDCDNLKKINDQDGHDKGDIYIKTASQLICRIFQHSPVFRVGGDEFAVILQNEDYRNREALAEKFEETRIELCAAARNRWEEPHVAIGVAVYDPELDDTVDDTVRRADKKMYENKRLRKEQA
ncbi:MAG: transporter substrate-binding domain-containing protein [Acidaminococcaceae bacterium]|nr:transporter substrate-binding domain-containing protein [Acidaminococcaceae bacterium]